MFAKNIASLGFDDVLQAHRRIKNHIVKTPILSSDKINKILNADIFFKMENHQLTHSFKARGAFNAILQYQNTHGNMPQKIVVQSSGNHAHAVAYIAKNFGIELLVYMASNVSSYKIDKVKSLEAEVIICQERVKANKLAEEKQEEGYFFIHPSNNNDVILGQATCAVEIFEELDNLSAIFIPCGGGGLVAGCYLAQQGMSPSTKIYACEPKAANDASISVKQNKIFSFQKSPLTIADGARTLSISKRCFEYLKKIAGIIEIEENRIKFWRDELEQELNQPIEATAALSIAGVEIFLQNNKKEQQKKYCTIVTGGNL